MPRLACLGILDGLLVQFVLYTQLRPLVMPLLACLENLDGLLVQPVLYTQLRLLGMPRLGRLFHQLRLYDRLCQ